MSSHCRTRLRRDDNDISQYLLREISYIFFVYNKRSTSSRDPIAPRPRQRRPNRSVEMLRSGFAREHPALASRGWRRIHDESRFGVHRFRAKACGCEICARGRLRPLCMVVPGARLG
jgi:hypothetical protein